MSLDLGDAEAKLKFQIINPWGGGGGGVMNYLNSFMHPVFVGVVSSNLLNIRDWTV